MITPAVRVITPPSGVAEGWDAADALAEGWTSRQAAALIAAAARPPAAEAADKPKKPGGRDWLIGLSEDCELWHDRERTAYATVPIDGHRQNLEVKSAEFRDWLAFQAFEQNGAVPASETIEAALRVVATIAVNRGQRYDTWRRVGRHDGKIYIDLGDAAWRAVEIEAAGWHIVDAPPVKFLRSRGMLALPEPEDGELIEALRGFLNIETDDDFKLMLAALAATLRPEGPFPVLVISGRQGSSKSTLARIVRLLIDPHSSPIRSLPKDERDLIVSAFNSWTLIFDNVSALPAWLSDALCRISTGGGFATRQLHSDRDETIFDACRPVIVNGIGDLAERADLGERALSLNLPPLADDRRRPERLFWAEFEQARPAILGALYNAISAGLRHIGTVRLDKPPRMADFAEWAEACAPGFGWMPGEFLAAYEGNRRGVTAAAAEASPLLPFIETLLGRAGREGIEGTASELLARLSGVCAEGVQRQKWFPRTAARLGTMLERDAPLLAPRGIEIVKQRHGPNGDRMRLLRCSSDDAWRELSARQRGQPEGGKSDE